MDLEDILKLKLIKNQGNLDTKLEFYSPPKPAFVLSEYFRFYDFVNETYSQQSQQKKLNEKKTLKRQSCEKAIWGVAETWFKA